MRRLRPQNVRTRLALWYVAVLVSLLLIYGSGATALVFLQLRSELDHVVINDLETIEGLFDFGSDGRLTLRSDYHDHPYPASAQGRLLEVLGDDGALLYRNQLLGARDLGGALQPGEGLNGYSIRTTRLSDGTRVRLVSKRHNLEGRATVIRVGFNEEPLWHRFWQVLLGVVASLPLVGGLAGLAGYFLAKHALSPIERMARRVHGINAERLNARLVVENPEDELGALAGAFNETLARLERSFEQLRRFTSDASHELRTPLTAIRSVGEVGLQKQGSGADYREVIASMLEESARLSRLVDSLLTIARADSGQIRLEPKTDFALPLVREVTSLLSILAEEKGQTLALGGDATIQVRADVAILRQVLTNLLDNAIKYSHVGSRISVRVLATGDSAAAIEVEDNGPGIPPEHRDRVFDRFYRVDEGRSREAGGAGLGLAFAKWGTEAHGGRLELICPNGSGCIFRLVLPASGPAETLGPPADGPRVSAESPAFTAVRYRTT
jgi:heavy metal sensor kinase